MAILDISQYVAQLPQTPSLFLLGGIFAPKAFFGLQIAILIRLGIALLLGVIIGIVHGWRYQDNIGFRTYGAVAIGSAAFSAIAAYLYLVTGSGASFANIGTISEGIGFICAAVIFQERNNIVHGLSTGATVWATSAVGTACGASMNGAAIGITAALIAFHLLPRHFLGVSGED